MGNPKLLFLQSTCIYSLCKSEGQSKKRVACNEEVVGHGYDHA